MKTRYIFCILLFLYIAIPLIGQQHIFKLSPFSLVAGRISGGFEHLFSQKMSFGIAYYFQAPLMDFYYDGGQGVGSITKTDFFMNNYSIQNIGFIPEIRYYFQPKKSNMRGLYLNGYGKYEYSTLNTSIEHTGIKLLQYSFSVGGSIGYQFIIKKHFSIDTFFGGNEGIHFFRGEFQGDNVNDAIVEIRKILKPIVNKHLSSYETFRYGKIHSFYPFATIRTGLSLGYAF